MGYGTKKKLQSLNLPSIPVPLKLKPICYYYYYYYFYYEIKCILENMKKHLKCTQCNYCAVQILWPTIHMCIVLLSSTVQIMLLRRICMALSSGHIDYFFKLCLFKFSYKICSPWSSSVLCCVVKVNVVTPKQAGILAQPLSDSTSQSARKRKSVVIVDPTEESSPDMTFPPLVCYILHQYIGILVYTVLSDPFLGWIRYRFNQIVWE